MTLEKAKTIVNKRALSANQKIIALSIEEGGWIFGVDLTPKETHKQYFLCHTQCVFFVYEMSYCDNCNTVIPEHLLKKRDFLNIMVTL